MARKNIELLREETLKQIENHMQKIMQLAAACKLSQEELLDLFRFILEES